MFWLSARQGQLAARSPATAALQLIRGIHATALAALQQSAMPPSAAAAAAAAAAPAEAAQQTDVSKMNFCNAVNSALHIAMAADAK